MYNPEFAMMNSIDRKREQRIELSPNMVRAHARAEKEVLSNSEYVIQESDFNGVYDAGSIQRDVALADRLEHKFDSERTAQDRNTKMMADTFEAIILMQSEMGEWLGSNASTLKTSRFDDFTNKVDMVVEWNSPGEGQKILALAIDITFGLKSIEKKLTEIRHEIDRGQLGSMKYFRDEAGNTMGPREHVARTVVGISQPVVEELARLWMDNKNKELGAHPIQKLMLDQIAFQLSKMQQYASKLGKHDIAQSYQEALTGIMRVRAEKQAIDVGGLRDDPVRLEIVEQTKAQFS